jgi:hypothetical protein
LPLALSWLSMSFEGLWIQGVISRKPDAETQLAAVGLHGILAASLGLTIRLTVELGYLYISYRRGHAALCLHWQSAVAPSLGN